MKRVKTILKATVGGLVLALVMTLAGCGDGGHRMSYGRHDYPTYSSSHHDGGGGGGGGHRSASRDDSWRHR